MKKIVLSIEGMTCSACSNGLEKYLKKQEKIKDAKVNLVLATASIVASDDVTIEELNKYISEAGFKSRGVVDLTKESKRISKVPFIIYGVLAIFLMYISMAQMLHLPSIPFLDMMEYPINYSLCLLILSIPFLVFGRDILLSGIKNLIHRMPNMDTLVTIGVLASFIYSFYGVIMVLMGNVMNVENLYFESVALVIYFIKLGRFIDNDTHLKTKDAIKGLVTVTPKYAKIKTDEGIKEVTIDNVKKGDILICLAGEKFAVDGIVIKGVTHTDESFITGEVKPVKKGVNDKVIAGSINYEGVVLYKALKIGKDSMISEIVNLVVEATNSKMKISLMADKICSYFVPIIMVIALLTLIISLGFNDPLNISLTRFVSVLVVACPCSLGLATPLAIVIAEGLCAKKGILVKSSEVLEVINKVDTYVFDKTGTLTNGDIRVSEFYNFSKKKDSEVLAILGSLESFSTHPIANSIMKYLKSKNIKYENIEGEILEGKGVKGKIDNNIYYVGSKKIVNDLNIKNDYVDKEKELTLKGNSIVYIIENKKIIGLVGVKDTLKKESFELIKELKKRNVDIIMLTGDNKDTASIIGNSLGIDKIIADCLPKEKIDVINELKNDKKVVAMVGDGINDAPSLVKADVGISFASGVDIATNSASVILMNDNLLNIILLLKISKKTLRNIKQNLFWALIYNILMIPIACGLLNKWNIVISPMIASLAMVLSSLFVSLNALRLKSERLG